MSRQKVVYEVIRAADGEMLTQHRTRQATIATCPEQHTGVLVKIVRWPPHADGSGVLVVKGTWHEDKRADGADPADD